MVYHIFSQIIARHSVCSIIIHNDANARRGGLMRALAVQAGNLVFKQTKTTRHAQSSLIMFIGLRDINYLCARVCLSVFVHCARIYRVRVRTIYPCVKTKIIKLCVSLLLIMIYKDKTAFFINFQSRQCWKMFFLLYILFKTF